MKLEFERLYFILVFAAIIGSTVLLLASTSTMTRGYVGPAALHVGEQMELSREHGEQFVVAGLTGNYGERFDPPDGWEHEGGGAACTKEKYSWQQVCVRNWGRAWGG